MAKNTNTEKSNLGILLDEIRDEKGIQAKRVFREALDVTYEVFSRYISHPPKKYEKLLWITEKFNETFNTEKTVDDIFPKEKIIQ